MRVVASVGSADNAKWLVDDVGVGAVINYRETPDLVVALAQAAPEGVDIYFDNVGGKHLEAALAVANVNARFVLCGMISGYSAEQPQAGPSNIFTAIEKRIRLQGLIGSDHLDLSADFNMIGWLKAGQVKIRETVVDGLDNAPSAFIDLFKGTARCWCA